MNYVLFVLNLIGLIGGVVDDKLWLLLICGFGTACCLAGIVEGDSFWRRKK